MLDPIFYGMGDVFQSDGLPLEASGQFSTHNVHQRESVEEMIYGFLLRVTHVAFGRASETFLDKVLSQVRVCCRIKRQINVDILGQSFIDESSFPKGFGSVDWFCIWIK